MSHCGQINLFPYIFAPKNYLFCDGTILAIAPYAQLYSLLGNVFGGDGVSNFALPDLRGRAPYAVNAVHPLGSLAGAETVVLAPAELPSHDVLQGVPTRATDVVPTGNMLAVGRDDAFCSASPNASLDASAVSTAGGGTAHNNMSPYLAMNYCIWTQADDISEGAPWLGEIRPLGAATTIPTGWALCQGQLLSIAANAPLFSLLGVNFGGDGVTNFGLPDLRGRHAIGAGQGVGLTNRFLGEVNGAEIVALSLATTPVHAPTLAVCEALADDNVPTGRTFAIARSAAYAPPGGPSTAMAAQSVVSTGTGVPHENRSPFLAMNFIIALNGIYPST